ncbi:MerR family transcriptional regulator, partial [Amycolatopsis sp. NPDC026612]|uniref:MerR family transcriptional regulator n=1 Tax=Amycolatopsis sp. NPDC026612 TaxID=3155466 RepID=UPI0033F30FE1
MEPENVDAPPVAGAWAPGKVAELLGVSPVTLRSWSARYGIRPPAGAGRHRRYSDADVRRLQHMQRLRARWLGRDRRPGRWLRSGWRGLRA